MIRPAVLAALLSALAGVAGAVTLDLPGDAVGTAERVERGASVRLPSGAWDGAQVPVTRAAGTVTRTAWQLRGQMITPLQLRDALVPQLQAEGWTVTFECRDRVCGGYDFRFASNALPAPAMYVDLGNFRYLLAEHGTGARLSLMLSRGGGSAFVQLTHVAPEGGASPEVSDSSTPNGTSAPAAAPGPSAAAGSTAVIDGLRRNGRAVLEGLLFATGAATLDPGESSSLRALADYLSERPGMQVAIVGHTDTEGGLDPNVALSRRRAQAVRDALVDDFGVDPGQVTAHGVGFLAPRANNDTAEGRLANRRVEVVRITN